MTRSIEALVEEQVRRWQLLRQQPREEVEVRPVVTVTGQHGARADELSLQLASELGFDHFDREIIHRVAESAQLSESVVSALDGKKRALFTDWLAAVASRNYFGPTEYRYHLAHVIGAIAHQGGAVIVGRGAHLLLGDKALRVLAAAPLEDRVRTVMEAEGLSERDARRRIVEVESNRHAFILMHYRVEFADPTAFDLVVNTAALGLDGATAAVRAALATRPPRTAPVDADARAPGAGS
jgi:cytidylate kinase